MCKVFLVVLGEEELKKHIFCTKANGHCIKNYGAIIGPSPSNNPGTKKLLKKALTNENFTKMQLMINVTAGTKILKTEY